MRTPVSALIGLAAVLVLVAEPEAARAAAISRSYSYFTVSGSTLAELQEQLSSRGPTVQGSGKRHAGATRMEFKDRVRFVEDGGKCRVASATVNVSARIILPRWSKRGSATPETRLVWDALSSDIKRHEESHLSIARNHARAMEEALKALPAEADCEALASKGREVIAHQLRKHDAEQTRFDRIEAINFQDRLDRLIRYRASRARSGSD